MFQNSPAFSFVGLWALTHFLLGATCFQAPRVNTGVNYSMTAKTELFAWTMPSASSTGFGSLKSTWYNEYNPTARQTTYDDSPFDYTFVAVSDDWPTTWKTTPTNEANRPPSDVPNEKMRLNIFRKAHKWVKSRRH